MKKILSGLIAAFLLSAGFVAVSAETAQAACVKSRYVQCPATATKPKAPKTVKKGKKAKVTVTVSSQGAVKPKGTLIVTIKGPGVKKTIRIAYNGKGKAFSTPAFKKKGTYTVTIVFKGNKNFKDAPKKVVKIKVKK